MVWKMERRGHQVHQPEELLTFQVWSLLKNLSCFIYVDERMVNF